MRYQMTGSQPIKLEDGRTVAPGSGVFEASISEPLEAFLVKIGAIKIEPRVVPDRKAKE